MEPLSLIVYHNDPGTAQTLAVNLSKHFSSVRLATRFDDVRSAIERNQPDVLVFDLETSRSEELGRLHHDFPSLCIVGTHRLADDQMWAEALNQGAADICEPRKDDVLRSVMRERMSRAAA